jgi:Ca2+-binding RTX toxin-like protein
MAVSAAVAVAYHDPAHLLPQSAEAVVFGPTISAYANGGLTVVDSAGHNARVALREDPDKKTDAIVASGEHLNIGTGCKYLSQSDTDPTNDTEPGYDKWVRCENATGVWALVLGDGDDQVSVSHPTRTTSLGGKDAVILAGAGKDTIFILDGSADVNGQEDNDKIHGGPKDDTLRGGPGYDTLLSGLGRGTGHDELFGDAGNDTLIGRRSTDVLTGGPGLDVLKAGAGRDTINGRDGEADEINCGGDDAVADALHFDPGIDKLFHCGVERRRNPTGV